MSRQAQRALIASLMMILASLAGCVGTDDLNDDDASSTDALGTVMVSTYHIQQLVSAVGGDLVDVEMMSTSNIPVHDYEPSAQDLIRLQSADLFFYHGLGLEPWVESTLDTMGSDAPVATSTHALPTGEVDLDYESMMVAKLCGFLSEPSTTNVHILSEHAEDAGELHGDEGAYNMAFPEDEHDEEHHDEDGEHDDEHHDEDGEHDDEHHDEDGEHHDEEGEHDDEHHDEHDHGEDGQLRAEETIEDAEGCPAGTVISVYHFEEGSYMLEFESEDEMETFQMAIAAMGGAHHHHDHDDDEHDEHEEHSEDEHDEHGVCHDMDTHENHDEYEDEESCEAAGYLWMEEDHDDHTGVCHDEDTHENHDEYEDEESCEAAGYHWMEGDHEDHDDDITPEEALSQFDTDGDDNLSWDEFWVAWTSEDDHDDEHDHGDDEHDENEGNVWTEIYDNCDDEEDALSSYACWNDAWDEDGDGTPEDSNSYWNYECQQLTDGSWECSTDHINYYDHCAYDNDYDYECWLDEWDTDNDGSYDLGSDGYTDEECEELADGRWACEHAEDEDDHDDHSPLEEAIEEYMMDTLMTMFNESDADSSGGLSLDELEHFIEDLDAMDEDGYMPTGEYMIGVFDEDGDSLLSFEEFSEMMGMEHDDHHDENETHDEEETAEEEFLEAMMQMMFEMYDANSDGSLDAAELDTMLEMMGEDDEHHEEGVAFIAFHVEAEGEYGIALPAGVSLHVLMDGDHEGHDHGHDGHDEESHDEDEEGHDEDEEGHDEDDDHDDHSDEEALAYDPHSWLDPLAFKEQVEVVVGVMSTAFPDGADAFRANADAYLAELDALDEGFEAAFGENGTCSNNIVASNHNAYAYLAQRYDLEFVTVHGLDPEGEPSAEDIAEVVERIDDDGLTVLFVEEYTNADAVTSLVQQTVSDDLPNGVTVLTLYTMEMAPLDDSDDYLSLMNKNLENLKTGLSC